MRSVSTVIERVEKAAGHDIELDGKWTHEMLETYEEFRELVQARVPDNDWFASGSQGTIEGDARGYGDGTSSDNEQEPSDNQKPAEGEEDQKQRTIDWPRRQEDEANEEWESLKTDDTPYSIEWMPNEKGKPQIRKINPRISNCTENY
jgi:hypothetical protein